MDVEMRVKQLLIKNAELKAENEELKADIEKQYECAATNAEIKAEVIRFADEKIAELEEQILETQKTADHFILMDKHHKKLEANSVPFAVVRRFCSNEKCEFSMETIKGKWDCRWHPQDKCPLIPRRGNNGKMS
jgi:predicted RNase H-like nuclease (RuvC/YqgF family)